MLPCMYFYFLWRFGPSLGQGLPFRGFAFTLRHTTLDRTPLDYWSARRRDLYLTTHNTHKGQTFTPQAGFKPAIPAHLYLQVYFTSITSNTTFTYLDFPEFKIFLYFLYQQMTVIMRRNIINQGSTGIQLKVLKRFKF